MKRLLAALSVVLFANQASAETIYYRGYKAELILMYGEVLRPVEHDTGAGITKYPSGSVANYHIKLMPEAYNKMRSEQMPEDIISIFQGIYLCEVGSEYMCRRDIVNE
jgi:hypothetical protein